MPSIVGSNALVSLYNGVTLRRSVGAGALLYLNDQSNITVASVDTNGKASFNGTVTAAAPTSNNHLTTKDYVDTAISSKADTLSRTSALVVETDFYNTTSPFAQGLTGAAISAGAIGQASSLADHPGIIGIKDSTTSGGGYRVLTATNAFNIAGGEKSVCTFKTSYKETTFKSYIGFHTATSVVAPTDGIYLELTGDGTSVTVEGKTSSNSARSATATNYSMSVNDWASGVITVNSDATSVLFELYSDNDTLLWSDTLTTNIPKPSNRYVGAGVTAGNSSTAAATYILYVDYFRAEINRTLAR